MLSSCPRQLSTLFCLIWLGVALYGCGTSGVLADDELGVEEFVRPAAAVTSDTKTLRQKRGLYVDSWTEHRLADGQWVIHGIFKTSVAENGRLIEEYSYDKGVPHGPYRVYDDDTGVVVGEGVLVDGLRQGVCRRFWPGGRMEAEGDYWKGREVGLHRQWHRNGRLQREGAFALDPLGNSVEAGLWRYWFDNGQLQREGCFDFRWGGRHGPWRGWHRNGGLAWQGEFTVHPSDPDSWEKSGVWKYWHENWSLAAIGEYEEGAMTPGWLYWAPDGSRVGHSEFASKFARGALTEFGK